MKIKFLISFLVISLLGYFLATHFESKKLASNNEILQSRPPIQNVLFLSFCSVNSRLLPTFGLNISDDGYPNMSKLFNSSFNFTNAYTNLTWSNALRYLFAKRQGLSSQFTTLSKMLDQESDGIKIFFMHISGEEDPNAQFEQYFNNDRVDLPLNHFDQVEYQVDLRNKNAKDKNIWMVHFKQMHYPYLTSNYLSSDEIMQKTFSPTELKTINSYRAHPDRYPDKLAYFQILFGDKSFQKLFFNKDKLYLSYVTDVKSVELWKKSKNADIDLSILKKSYDLRLKDMDKLVGIILEYYKKLEHNTVLVASGDHGETFSEHDYFSHGTIPYDEVIRFFYSIHFPYQTEKRIITRQISQKTSSKIIEDILANQTTENGFYAEQIMRPPDDNIISYSCAGDIISVRMKNKWKFLYYRNDETYKLFDILLDPKESIDVSKINAANENLSLSLKIRVLDHLSNRRISNTNCMK